jgi:uncharacterized repeat protein (TIGR02543 family)
MPRGEIMKILSVVIAGGIFASSLLFAQTPVLPPGRGTSDDPYRISELSHLAWMSATVAHSGGKHYKLQNDIDANVTKTWNDEGTDSSVLEGFAPIGGLHPYSPLNEPLEGFFGCFDGQKHVIKNLYINRPLENLVGLFGYVNGGGIVQRVSLEGGRVVGRSFVGGLVGFDEDSRISENISSVSVSGRGDYVGGLVGCTYISGYNQNSSINGNWISLTVTNCGSSGSVRSELGWYVGGLIGYNGGSSILGCFATGSVVGGERVGGLIGYNGGSSILGCFATGSVVGGERVGGIVGENYFSGIGSCYARGSVTGEVDVGGLVGYNESSTINKQIKNSYASGVVSGGYNVGGFAGTGDNTKFVNCYSIGPVSAAPVANVGGFIGSPLQGSIVENCYWNIETSGQPQFDVGRGTGLSSSEMANRASYVNWDYINVWDSSPGLNGMHPYLRSVSLCYSLNTSAGSGTILRDLNLAVYSPGSAVSLTAIQNPGYHFVGWSGAIAGSSNPVTVIMTNDLSVMANFALNVITVFTDCASVSVPEGGAANFQIKLSAQPSGDTVVSVSRASGDRDITATSGTTLIFGTNTWNAWQTVTLAGVEDDVDNENGEAVVRCSSPGISNAIVTATEIDDDYTLTVISTYGTVSVTPDTSYYDKGTLVTLTATPDPAYYWKGYSGDFTETNSTAFITMNGNKSVTAIYGPTALEMLPPSKIAKTSFTARWKWVEGGAPEGQIRVLLDAGLLQVVSGYENRYVVNSTECLVTNLLSNKTYSYWVRRLMPDGSYGPWSAPISVRTGTGIPVFNRLLSDVSVSKGISQEFAISNLVTGGGTVSVKSSNANAVKATVRTNSLTLQYLWSGTNTAKVTLTLTHPATGYQSTYSATLGMATGNLAVGSSALTNAGTVAAQNLTVMNRTGGTVYGIRVQATGLSNTTWLINRTGFDPVSKAPILELPCVLPAGSQMVVRLVYNKAYKTQATTGHPVKYGAWAIMTPVHSAMPVTGEMTITKQDLYDGLGLLRVPVNRNRMYTVYHSDNGGSFWYLDAPVVRATANYLMWLDIDESAPVGRLYRVIEAGM